MADWTLCTFSDAAQLVTAVHPRAGADPRSARARGQRPQAWYAQRRHEGPAADALMLLSHALPRYECVVWALRCLIEGGGEGGAVPRHDPCIQAALRWIDSPLDGPRRSAREAAETGDADSPAGLLCQAIFTSGGSLSGEDLPPVPPPADTCAKLAAAAVLAAAYAAPDPALRLEAAFALGEAMLEGRA